MNLFISRIFVKHKVKQHTHNTLLNHDPLTEQFLSFTSFYLASTHDRNYIANGDKTVHTEETMQLREFNEFFIA